MSPEDPTPVTRAAKLLGGLVAVRAAFRGLRDRTPQPPQPVPESDIDPSERTVPANRRAETLVAGLLLVAGVFGFAFTVLYIVLSGNTQLLGIALGGALCLLAAACIVAGLLVVPQETHVEDRGVL